MRPLITVLVNGPVKSGKTSVVSAIERALVGQGLSVTVELIDEPYQPHHLDGTALAHHRPDVLVRETQAPLKVSTETLELLGVDHLEPTAAAQLLGERLVEALDAKAKALEALNHPELRKMGWGRVLDARAAKLAETFEVQVEESTSSVEAAYETLRGVASTPEAKSALSAFVARMRSLEMLASLAHEAGRTETVKVITNRTPEQRAKDTKKITDQFLSHCPVKDLVTELERRGWDHGPRSYLFPTHVVDGDDYAAHLESTERVR
jgi:hypothetical protein